MQASNEISASKAAVARNHHVEQKKNRRVGTGQRQDLFSARAHLHAHPGLLQLVGNQTGDIGIVFEDNDILFQTQPQFFWLRILPRILNPKPCRRC